MKYFVYSNVDHYELIKRYNPLHLRHNGLLRVFEDDTDCYVSWFEYLRSLYPKGYFEFAHFFRVILEFNALEECSFYNYCRSRHNTEPLFLVDWSNLGEIDFDYLRTFTMSVQLYYNTVFRLDKFKEAFNIFKSHESKSS